MPDKLDLHEIVARVVADLAALRLRYALIGGLAVSARAEPRFTKDIDVAIAVGGDRDAEQVVRSLGVRGYEMFAQIEHEARARLATMRLRTPRRASAQAHLDLMFASCGIEAEIVAAAETIAIAPGVALPVARTGHLIAMKCLSASDVRLQDRIDLRVMLKIASAGEIERAQQALALITQRGFHRDKDLLAELERIRKDLASGS